MVEYCREHELLLFCDEMCKWTQLSVLSQQRVNVLKSEGRFIPHRLACNCCQIVCLSTTPTTGCPPSSMHMNSELALLV